MRRPSRCWAEKERNQAWFQSSEPRCDDIACLEPIGGRPHTPCPSQQMSAFAVACGRRMICRSEWARGRSFPLSSIMYTWMNYAIDRVLANGEKNDIDKVLNKSISNSWPPCHTWCFFFVENYEWHWNRNSKFGLSFDCTKLSATMGSIIWFTKHNGKKLVPRQKSWLCTINRNTVNEKEE